MRYLEKGREPNVLIQHREAGGTWDDFTLSQGKKEVKKQLLAEQNNQCAYCTQLIGFDDMKVEHWFPRNPSTTDDKTRGQQLQLNYNNLLAVCHGCIGKDQHCDTSKAEKKVTISPLQEHHIETISYNKIGVIRSSDKIFQKDIDEVLRLNLPALQEQRKRVLVSFIHSLRNKNKRRKPINFSRLLRTYQAEKKPMSMIVIKYLERKVR